jgi:hypothetical protein
VGGSGIGGLGGKEAMFAKSNVMELMGTGTLNVLIAVRVSFGITGMGIT